MKFSYPALTLGALAILAGLASPALAVAADPAHSVMQAGERHVNYTATYTGQNLAGGAKISIDAARNLALKAQPGSVADEELEKESCGSGLRYSFDIKSGAATHEVGVDAVTGAVLENSVEGPNAG